jgi:hypothetical protein
MSNEKCLGSLLLHCNQDGSDKEYKFQLLESPIGAYELIAMYGRRDRLRNRRSLGNFFNTNEVMVEFKKLVAAKLKKGYEITRVHDRPFLLNRLDEAMVIFEKGMYAYDELGVAPPALQIKAVEVVVTFNEGQLSPVW